MGARTLPEPVGDGGTIAAVAVELLRENRPERPVRLLGVRLGSFADTGDATGSEQPQAALPL